MATDLKNKEEIILAIKMATAEHDWEEVLRLYKLLFNLTDKKAS